MWLLVALADSKVELKRLARVLGARSLSFASPERLLNFDGRPISALPLAR